MTPSIHDPPLLHVWSIQSSMSGKRMLTFNLVWDEIVIIFFSWKAMTKSTTYTSTSIKKAMYLSVNYIAGKKKYRENPKTNEIDPGNFFQETSHLTHCARNTNNNLRNCYVSHLHVDFSLCPGTTEYSLQNVIHSRKSTVSVDYCRCLFFNLRNISLMGIPHFNIYNLTV